jgi:hypothetical protein
MQTGPLRSAIVRSGNEFEQTISAKLPVRCANVATLAQHFVDDDGNAGLLFATPPPTRPFQFTDDMECI